jgi:protein-S-isoprenylcysteine O-methyltransferase Ste14
VKLNIVTLAIIIVFIVAFVFRAVGLPWTTERIVGLAIALPACVLLVIARIQLGSAFSVQAKASNLVTTGLYSRIRNPIYVFSALFVAGIIIWYGQLRFLLIFVVLIPVQVLRSRKESQVLEEKFGPAYIAYKQKTWF